ncbi:sensor histidine kinase [Sphingosinicella ginsenosidimutans]|uniref:histidine kinase n=1 Tax=Allosphingosinicella ginsenosidimutans TaxID=1176539 RepID=A0A5C6TZ77_9SPHN|nr:HAMP domain-containing sensor histidine kinase [Sphingosinicella ginsenosidimutans]TXC64895.1 sensor histidine kinase [Sphingosinicella ginsenosidimutans]
MIGISALWIVLLLGLGGYTLDRVLTSAVTANFDAQLDYVLTQMIGSSDIGPDGEVLFTRQPADQRFLEPYSGLYYQISGAGFDPFKSRSLWDRQLTVEPGHVDADAHAYDSGEFADEKLRIVERDVRLPGSPVRWRFQIAQSRDALDAQIGVLRRILVRSFGLLGLGLIALAAIQAIYGLWPLRRVRRSIVAIRSGEKARIDERLPREIAPLVEELNALLEHNETQAEEARRHAGNLAHALKTPLTVINNEAMARSPDLPDTVIREARTMRRQVDHHLARARAIGRRSSAQARAVVWESLEAVERAVSRMYENVTVDLTGDRSAVVRAERQDLDEMLGNLIENAAKYGNGRVFVTVKGGGAWVEIEVEDDGPGIPEAEREAIFGRGKRLDTGKPGTGLGLGIVRDVAEIYGGEVRLEESEDLGGLLVRLKLPPAEMTALMLPSGRTGLVLPAQRTGLSLPVGRRKPPRS